jgi:hypothetical protein
VPDLGSARQKKEPSGAAVGTVNVVNIARNKLFYIRKNKKHIQTLKGETPS